ncbi:hypothetical protein [Streptomyces massasporeus]|uniref:hypothetical protein n=1 Tax=Streptomyces massasporeus TaxID=67324 RepID=UPI0036510A14
MISDEPAPRPLPKDLLRVLSTRSGDRRTIGRDDILAAATMQLFGGNLGQRALIGAQTSELGPAT